MTMSQQDRYVFQKKLGGGGMGDVWLASDALLNRPVAVKYLKATKDSIHKELFLSEARMLASLNHPNITLIYDAVFDEQQARYYLVMEYVEGQPLSNFIHGWTGPLPLEIILDVAIGVLQALQYAHEKGIVHRDIKPANVIIQKEGVKLTDFGVAGLISLLAQGSDYLVGTPAYMSPEQIEGQATDGRSDLYSLGVMLFEMVSGGYLPFHSNRQTEIFTAHLTTPPPSLRKFTPNVLLALERTIVRLLAKDPSQRYPSAGAVLEVFRSIQARQRYSQAHLQLLEPAAKPFINRADELNQLETMWAEIQKSAEPRLVIVKGEMGIGKSRLVSEFLGQQVVDKGFPALVGKCAEAGSPYSPYVDILAIALNKRLAETAPTPDQLDQLLEQIPGLDRLLNVYREAATKGSPSAAPPPVTNAGLWQSLSSKLAGPVTATPPSAQWQLFGTVLAILAKLGPTVIFLEDATWLDEASVALTRYLIRQEQLPLLLIAACRETDEARPWLDSLAADEKIIMTVPPLATPAIKDYLTSLIGGTVSEEVVTVLEERSQGHPLRLEELSRQLIESQEIYQEEDLWRYTSKKLEAQPDAFLPKAVISAFARQIDSLAENHREALALATLLEPGPEFDFEVWLTLLGGEAQRELAQTVLNEAVKKRLVRQLADHRYTFRSADIDKALAAIVAESRQREIHRQLAEILSQRQANPTLIGYHYERAGLTDQAAQTLESAGTEASATHAFDTAIHYYRRAVSLRESGAAYQALGQLYTETGKLADSLQAFQRAGELTAQEGNVTEQAHILNSAAGTFWRYDHYKEAYQHAAAVLKLAGLPEVERAIAQTHLGMILWLLGRLSEAESWGQKAVQSWLKSGSEAGLAEAYYRLGRVYLSQGKLADAQIIYQRALEQYQKLADPQGEGDCLTGLGRVALERGSFEQSQALLDSAQQLFEQTNHQSGLLVVYTNQGRAKLYQGAAGETLVLLKPAFILATKLGKLNAYLLSDIYILIAQASLAVSRPDQAGAAATEALKLARAAGNQEYAALAQATLGQILAAQGDPAAAEATYQKALGSLERLGARLGLLRTQLNYAYFLGQQGQTARATPLEQAAREQAAQTGLYLA